VNSTQIQVGMVNLIYAFSSTRGLIISFVKKGKAINLPFSPFGQINNLRP